MSERPTSIPGQANTDSQRPAYLPTLPPLWERTQYIPAPLDAGAANPAAAAVEPSTRTIETALLAPAHPEPPAPTEGAVDQTQPDTTTPREKQPSVTLTGRVAALPTFRTSPKSRQLVGQFPLAAHEVRDGEVVTAYHRIVGFGARAERMRDLQLGEELQVMGYKHEGTTKAGKPKTEIYLAAFRRPKPPQP